MGREFLDVFSEWAESYDDSVEGKNPQYKAVFKNYDTILNEIVLRSGSRIIEFGVGTGNLTKKLLTAGKTVFPIEPSKEMRRLAKEKLPSFLTIYDGDLQNYPKPNFHPDTIVSSFVFHHLTDEEKGSVLKDYTAQLDHGGKIIFADTLFESESAYLDKIKKAKMNHFFDLADDLESEYYPLVPTLEHLFTEAGFEVSFEQMNEYAWIAEAVKIS